MNSRRAYEIPFVGLKPGHHQFSFEIKEKFFEPYQQQDFTECDAKIELDLEKHTGFMLLKFSIGGSLKVLCDRCGNSLPMQLWDEFNIVVKLVENPEEMNDQEDDPDIYYISRNESHLQLSDWIYEFINLSIPMTKMCEETEMGGPQCNKEVLEKLNKLKQQEATEQPKSDIWKGLEQFKGLDN
jgi:uncharacterized metal-binding protein YceD (DUF177 family)